MKTTLKLAAAMALATTGLATAAWAECPMQLGPDGKPMAHKEAMDCCKDGKDCCKDDKECAECCKGGKCEKHLGGHESHGAHGDHGAHAVTAGDDSPSTQSYKEGMARMHQGMDIAYTGDADIDFLRGMIAHHQGAVDMAQTQLQYGKDAQVKKLSRDIIRAQNLEIRWMKKWLGQLEARKAGHTDAGWLGKH